MTGAEYGFLLLTSKLGNPDRKPLTVAQLRELFNRSQLLQRKETALPISSADLVTIGYGRRMADHIVELLQEEMLLQTYLRRAEKADCLPVTRASEAYPAILRSRLGLDSPGVLWAKGDLDLLNHPAISLVGSRALCAANREFAAEAGRQAARQGLILVSGNARGADQTAQNACLAAGGKVIAVVADSLAEHSLRQNVLYLSEDGFDGAFSAQRALSRNRVIHSLGTKTIVAQCNLGKGGTWDGTTKNLQKGWSPVFCFDDRSDAAIELNHLGAGLIGMSQLADIAGLNPPTQSFLA